MRPEEDSEESSDSGSEVDLQETFKDLHMILQQNPTEKANRKQEFLCILGQVCTQLTSEENYTEILDCYHQALTLFPASEEILYNLGALLLQLGHPRESSLYLRKALEVCPDYLPAHYALLSVRNYLVERWHFRMLNDVTRNEAFRNSIRNRVGRGHKTVLDIGTGTGILSIFATEAGATEVWGCDVSDTMIEMATEIVAANGVSKKVHLLNKISMDIKIPEDIPQRVSLVVTETFDAALFGEGVLVALQHAWQHLLLPSPEGVVIPHSASLWIAPIECADTSRRYVLQPNPEKLLKMPNVEVSSEMTDPYDTENLLRVPGGFRLLSEPVKAFSVNFNSLEDIESLLNSEETTISICCNTSGRFDAVAAWFDLIMDDRDVLTTRPFLPDNHPRASCWEQAVFPQYHLTPVDEGTTLKLLISNKESRLEIKTLNEEQPRANVKVPQNVVCFLNNVPWVKEFCETADKFFELWKNLRSVTEILDLSPFPVLGLRFLSRCGLKSRWNLTCYEYNENYARFVKAVAAENGIPESRIHFIKEEDGLPEKMFQLIVWNFFDPKGELDEKAVAQYPEIKSLVAPEGLIVPHNVAVRCELVECEFLYKCSRVENDSRQIADFINIYEVKHHLDLNLDSLGATPLCKDTEVLRLQVDQLGPGGLFSEQKRSICVKIERDGIVHAVIYWFLIEMLSNSGQFLSTRGPLSHILQAAVLTSPLVPAQIGQNIKLAVPYHYGLLQIEVMEND